MPTWAKWGLALVVVAIAAYGVREYAQAREAAREADARADSALRVAAQDSARLDSALSVLDSVQTREAQVRDSLRTLLREADREADEASGQVEVRTASLDTALAALGRRVRPELRPAVDTVRSKLDSLQTAHSRFAAAMRSKVRLLASDTASLKRELVDTRSALSEARERIDSQQAALQRLREARDRWRDAAHPFGLSVSGEVWGLVGLGLGLSTHLLR